MLTILQPVYGMAYSPPLPPVLLVFSAATSRQRRRGMQLVAQTDRDGAVYCPPPAPPPRSRDAHSSCARAPALKALELLPPTPAVVGAALAALPVLVGSGVCAACLPPEAEEPVDLRRHVCSGCARGDAGRCGDAGHCGSAGRPDARPALPSSPSSASCRASSCAARCEAASSLRLCSSCANAAAWSSTNNPPATTYPTSPTSPAGKKKHSQQCVQTS